MRRKTARIPHPWPYVIAVAIAMLMLAVRFLLGRWGRDPVLDEHSSFLLFIIAVLISTWVGGFGPGLLTTVLCALWSTYFFVAPTFALRIDNQANGLELGIFVTEGLLIAYLTITLQKARW